MVVQSGLKGYQEPWRTILLSHIITILFLSKWDVQLWLDRRPIESSASIGKSGNVWTLRVVSSSDGSVCVLRLHT